MGNPRRGPGLWRSCHAKIHEHAAVGVNILVVEDEPTVAALIADVLTEEGHRVDTLLDSRVALDPARRKELFPGDLRSENAIRGWP